MNQRIDWPWFVLSQVGFGIVAGLVVARQQRVPTWQHLPLAVRAGIEAPGLMRERDGGERHDPLDRRRVVRSWSSSQRWPSAAIVRRDARTPSADDVRPDKMLDFAGLYRAELRRLSWARGPRRCCAWHSRIRSTSPSPTMPCFAERRRMAYQERRCPHSRAAPEACSPTTRSTRSSKVSVPAGRILAPCRASTCRRMRRARPVMRGGAGRCSRRTARRVTASDGQGARASSIVDGSYLALVSDQGLRTTVIAGRPELGAPDWRGNVPGRTMTSQDISDVVAWLSAQRPPFPGQPH